MRQKLKKASHKLNMSRKVNLICQGYQFMNILTVSTEIEAMYAFIYFVLFGL